MNPTRLLAAMATAALFAGCDASPDPEPSTAPALPERPVRAVSTLSTDTAFAGEVREVLGVVAGEAILGVNVFRDLFAGIRDIIGGRAGGYQKALREARDHAMDDMADEAKRLGADAIIGIDIDYEAVDTEKGSLLMVSCNGTAVKLR